MDSLTKRWDMNAKVIAQLESVGDWAYATAYAKGGAAILTGAWTGAVSVWNQADGARLASLTTNPAPDAVLAAQPVQVAAAATGQ